MNIFYDDSKTITDKEYFFYDYTENNPQIRSAEYNKLRKEREKTGSNPKYED